MNISSLSSTSSCFSGMQPPPKPADGAEPGSEEFFEQMSSDMMDQLDADGDGVISLEEFGDEEKFSEIDADGDGSVTTDELISDAKAKHEQFMTMHPEMGSMEGFGAMVLDALDTDGDDVVSLEEFGDDEDKFSAMDLDGDGSLTVEELDEYATANQEQMGPPPGPPPEMASMDELGSTIAQKLGTQAYASQASYSATDYFAQLTDSMSEYASVA